MPRNDKYEKPIPACKECGQAAWVWSGAQQYRGGGNTPRRMFVHGRCPNDGAELWSDHPDARKAARAADKAAAAGAADGEPIIAPDPLAAPVAPTGDDAA